jgi:hypothetical protein
LGVRAEGEKEGEQREMEWERMKEERREEGSD